MTGRTGRERALWDPGAQPERTYQAWTRTALAFTVSALLATRLAPHSGWTAPLVSVIGALVALLVVQRQKRRLHSTVIRSAPAAIVMMTGLTVLLAIAALALLAIPAMRT